MSVEVPAQKVARRRSPASHTEGEIELSIVMPCLDEAETLEACLTKAIAAIEKNSLSAEIIVADNGSTDGSQEIATRLGARVVPIAERGYGNALREGIDAAKGKYVLMGDADDSYDFSDIGPFIDKLREGADLVMGNRFAGGIKPGAMPWMHRWIGNPVLTTIGRVLFKTKARDFHCGMRAFSADAYRRLELHTTGMEFASEMVMKASLQRMSVTEVPIVLYKDGRSRPPHLRSWRDGWRHLRFMLLLCPRWLFLIPGGVLFLLGLAGSTLLISGPQRLGPMVLDIHSLLVTSFLSLIGYQLLVFAVFTKVFAMREGFHPPNPDLDRLFNLVSLEGGLAVGALMTVGGIALLVVAYLGWQATGFGQLDPRVTMRQAIPAMVLIALGIQTVFASFFLSILGISADHWRARAKSS